MSTEALEDSEEALEKMKAKAKRFELLFFVVAGVLVSSATRRLRVFVAIFLLRSGREAGSGSVWEAGGGFVGGGRLAVYLSGVGGWRWFSLGWEAGGAFIW